MNYAELVPTSDLSVRCRRNDGGWQRHYGSSAMEAEVVGQADVVCCVTEVLPSLFFCLRHGGAAATAGSAARVRRWVSCWWQHAAAWQAAGGGGVAAGAC